MLSFFKKKDTALAIGAPCKGKCVPLSEVSDPTFGEEMLGPGVAVIPAEGKIVAPADGDVELVFSTLHAISLKTGNGAEVLIHVGLDTVKRNGEGFTCHVQAGDKVKKGDLLLEVDLEGLKADGFDTIIPIVICNSDEFSSITGNSGMSVEALDEVIVIKK